MGFYLLLAALFKTEFARSLILNATASLSDEGHLKQMI